MKRLFILFLIPFLSSLFATAQQEIPVEKKDRSTYTFKVPEFITVQDFEMVSAVTTNQPDLYVLNIRAKDASGNTDPAIQGKLLFEINGETKPVDFVDGLGQVQAEIKGTDKITMRAIDSDVTRTGTIKHPFNWSKIAGLALAVIVLAAVIWFIQKRKKKTNKVTAV